MTTQAQTAEDHSKGCPICYAQQNNMNVYEILGATELWKWTRIHNKAMGISQEAEVLETYEECGRQVPVAEIDDHECDPEDLAERAADRREQYYEAFD